MKRIVRLLWSFAVGYVLIPLPFYVVDGIGHLPGLAILFPLVLNVALVLTAFGSFRLVEANLRRLRVERPFALGVGAAIGLFHWFPIYFFLGARFIWRPNETPGPWLSMFGTNLLFPLLAISGATYDGSLLALLFSPFLIMLLARGSRRRA